MWKLTPSQAREPNPQFKQKRRRKNESNVEWIERSLGGSDGETLWLILIGGVDPMSYRIRHAQSILRHDLMPSQWSHVALMRERPEERSILEISLDPPDGFGFAAMKNGLRIGKVEQYDDVLQFPNVGIVRIPSACEDLDHLVEQFKLQRNLVDAVELVVRWLGYLWQGGSLENPLQSGYGLPSAAFVEAVLGGCDIDLTPTAPSESSSPELIWQSIRWWSEYHDSQNRKFEGSWHVGQRYDLE